MGAPEKRMGNGPGLQLVQRLGVLMACKRGRLGSFRRAVWRAWGQSRLSLHDSFHDNAMSLELLRHRKVEKAVRKLQSPKTAPGVRDASPHGCPQAPGAHREAASLPLCPCSPEMQQPLRLSLCWICPPANVGFTSLSISTGPLHPVP